MAIRERLVLEGYSDIPTDWWLVAPVTLLLLVIFVGAVAGTMYFLLNPRAGRTPDVETTPQGGGRKARDT